MEDQHVKEFYDYYSKNEHQFASYKKKSYTMALNIVLRSPKFIKYVKKELQSNEMCNKAVKADPNCVRFIHEPREETIIIAIRNSKLLVAAFRYILAQENSFFTKSMVDEIIKSDSNSIYPLLKKKLCKTILTEQTIQKAFKNEKTSSIFHVGYKNIPSEYLTEAVINTIVHSSYNKFNVRIAECFGSSFLDRELKRLKLINGPPSVY